MAAAYKLASMALGFVSRMRRKAFGPLLGEWVSQVYPDIFFARRLSLAPTIHRSAGKNCKDEHLEALGEDLIERQFMKTSRAEDTIKAYRACESR